MTSVQAVGTEGEATCHVFMLYATYMQAHHMVRL